MHGRRIGKLKRIYLIDFDDIKTDNFSYFNTSSIFTHFIIRNKNKKKFKIIHWADEMKWKCFQQIKNQLSSSNDSCVLREIISIKLNYELVSRHICWPFISHYTVRMFSLKMSVNSPFNAIGKCWFDVHIIFRPILNGIFSTQFLFAIHIRWNEIES